MAWYWELLIGATIHIVLWILCAILCYHDTQEGCGDVDYSVFAGFFWFAVFPILIVRRIVKLILKEE